jgi:nucleoside-diphosphate-sugar epimerase
MRLLLLGGTKFFGRSIASDAIVRGHEVTLFTRGMTNPGLFGSAENVHGDRNMNLDLLKGRTFDVVIDTSGYHPRPVADAARSIDAALYCFISTISAYKDASEPGLREDSPLAELDGPLPDEFVPEQYGPLKVLCEQAVTENAAATLIVRPGLIVGPHDHTDRFTYWPVRAARGGKILVPGRPERAVQIIDVRDLAAWTLDATERGLKGTFNATGPNTELSMDEMVRACLQAAGTPSTLEWVDEAFLLEHKVEPWSDLPVWLPDEGDAAGLMRADCSAAIEEELTCRPVVETARDTLAWYRTERNDALTAGISAEREAELLTAWAD